MSFDYKKQPTFPVDSMRLRGVLDTLKGLYGYEGLQSIINDWTNDQKDKVLWKFDPYVDLEALKKEHDIIDCERCGTWLTEGMQFGKEGDPLDYCENCYSDLYVPWGGKK